MKTTTIPDFSKELLSAATTATTASSARKHSLDQRPLPDRRQGKKVGTHNTFSAANAAGKHKDCHKSGPNASPRAGGGCKNSSADGKLMVWPGRVAPARPSMTLGNPDGIQPGAPGWTPPTGSHERRNGNNTRHYGKARQLTNETSVGNRFANPGAGPSVHADSRNCILRHRLSVLAEDYSRHRAANIGRKKVCRPSEAVKINYKLENTMSDKTKIHWCDSTCNPAMGCDGCPLYPTTQGLVSTITLALGAAGMDVAKSRELVSTALGRMAPSEVYHQRREIAARLIANQSNP